MRDDANDAYRAVGRHSGIALGTTGYKTLLVSMAMAIVSEASTLLKSCQLPFTRLG